MRSVVCWVVEGCELVGHLPAAYFFIPPPRLMQRSGTFCNITREQYLYHERMLFAPDEPEYQEHLCASSVSYNLLSSKSMSHRRYSTFHNGVCLNLRTKIICAWWPVLMQACPQDLRVQTARDEKSNRRRYEATAFSELHACSDLSHIFVPTCFVFRLTVAVPKQFQYFRSICGQSLQDWRLPRRVPRRVA